MCACVSVKRLISYLSLSSAETDVNGSSSLGGLVCCRAHTRTHTDNTGWEMVYSPITQPASMLEEGAKSLNSFVHNKTSVTLLLFVPVSYTALFSWVAVKPLSLHQEFFRSSQSSFCHTFLFSLIWSHFCSFGHNYSFFMMSNLLSRANEILIKHKKNVAVQYDSIYCDTLHYWKEAI